MVYVYVLHLLASKASCKSLPVDIDIDWMINQDLSGKFTRAILKTVVFWSLERGGTNSSLPEQSLETPQR